MVNSYDLVRALKLDILVKSKTTENSPLRGGKGHILPLGPTLFLL